AATRRDRAQAHRIGGRRGAGLTLEAGPDFESLLEYLRDTRGFDFTGYKRPSLIRRVAVRCSELGIDNFRVYLDYLQVHAEEFGVLFDTILINVTELFLDRQAWDNVGQDFGPQMASD